MRALAIGGDRYGRRHEDTKKERRSHHRADFAGIEATPIEPNRHEWDVRSVDDEERRRRTAQSAGQRRDLRFSFRPMLPDFPHG